jgi:hypothetical protein
LIRCCQADGSSFLERSITISNADAVATEVVDDRSHAVGGARGSPPSHHDAAFVSSISRSIRRRGPHTDRLGAPVCATAAQLARRCRVLVRQSTPCGQVGAVLVEET